MKSSALYAIPNAITISSLLLGMAGVLLAVEGRFDLAPWFMLGCVLLDRLDGMTARKLKVSALFGMELDSLADLVAFGVSPAVLMYTMVVHYTAPGTGLRLFTGAASVLWVAASALRLAKYNVIAMGPGFEWVFQGTPMPFAASMLILPLILLQKYAAGVAPGYDPFIFSWHPSLMSFEYIPVWALVVAYLMVSGFKIPKMHKYSESWKNVYVMMHLLAVYVLAPLRLLPELLAFFVTEYVVISLVFHFSEEGRKVKKISMLEAMSYRKDND